MSVRSLPVPSRFCSKWAVSLLALSQLAGAGDSRDYYDTKAEGWFWYQDPKDAARVAPAPLATPSRTSEPPVFSTSWMRANMDRLRDEAIDHPTDAQGNPSKAVIAYMYLQRVAMDKAQNFANAAERAVQADPLLDENNRVPFGTAAVGLFNRTLDQDKKVALNALTRQTGLWFFFDSRCTFCSAQFEVLQRFTRKHPFKVRYISLDNKPLPGMAHWSPDQGQAKLLQLKITPTLVLIRPPDHFYVISQGLSPEETLARKILLVADSQKLLPPEQLKAARPFDKGVLTSDQLQPSSPRLPIPNDTEAWVDHLQKTLRGDY